jgi:hypothetical protein
MTEMSPGEEVFFAALEKATPAERAAYLDQACAGNPALRAQVEKMLAGLLPTAYTFTAADAGIHHFYAVKLKTAGTQSITAQDTVTASITGTEADIIVNPAAATHFKVVAPASVTAGTAFTITVMVLDQYGNVATGYTGTVHFTTNDPSTSVILPADYTFTTTDAGQHVFTNGATLRTVGKRTITATDTLEGTIKGVANVTLFP